MTPSVALRNVCACWERGDVDALVALFTDDGVYEDPLHPRILRGRADIQAVNAAAVDALEDCVITLHRIIENADVAFAEGYFASRVREAGERLDFPFAILVEMRDGRIARLAEYFDTRPLPV